MMTILFDVMGLEFNLDNLLEIIWLLLSSKFAVYTYLLIVLLLVIWVVALMLVNEIRPVRLIERKSKEDYEVELGLKLSDEVEVKENKDGEAITNNNSNKDLVKKEEILEDEVLDEGNGKNRFFMLTELDDLKDTFNNHHYNGDITLKEFSENFRNFSAKELGLYYDIKDIRRFIAGLSVTNIIILQGMSGTGKTSLAYAFGEFIKNPSVIVPVQPMWKERTDLIGYYNEFTEKFNETVLLQKLYEANYNESMYITVLDEINIARIEYYFAEFLSLLEIPDKNKRLLDVVSNKWELDPKLLENGRIKLPPNMWFVGTANNDDSTFAISDKVYDRAMVINLDRKAIPFLPEEGKTERMKSSTYLKLVSDARLKYKITNRSLRKIKELDNYLIKNFQITFGNRIMQQIRMYVPVVIASGGTELEAIDDILSKKVLRKLESKNLAYVKNMAESLMDFIDETFGDNVMTECLEYISNIEKNI